MAACRITAPSERYSFLVRQGFSRDVAARISHAGGRGVVELFKLMRDPTFCMICGGEGTIEFAPDQRNPWATITIPCPSCTTEKEREFAAEREADERRADR